MGALAVRLNISFTASIAKFAAEANLIERDDSDAGGEVQYSKQDLLNVIGLHGQLAGFTAFPESSNSTGLILPGLGRLVIYERLRQIITANALVKIEGIY